MLHRLTLALDRRRPDYWPARQTHLPPHHLLVVKLGLRLQRSNWHSYHFQRVWLVFRVNVYFGRKRVNYLSARSILETVYRLLSKGSQFVDLAPNYLGAAILNLEGESEDKGQSPGKLPHLTGKSRCLLTMKV